MAEYVKPSHGQQQPANTNLQQNNFICADCGQHYGRRSDLMRHILPKIECLDVYCLQEYRRDKRKEYLSHVIRRHPELDQRECESYFKGNSAPGGLY
jgi:hypothetical protein